MKRVHIRLLILVGIGALLLTFILLQRKEKSILTKRAAPTEQVEMATVPPQQSEASILEADLERRMHERQSIKKEWISAAEEVVNKTGDPEAREILDFLKLNTITVEILDEEHSRILEDTSKSEHLIYLLIVTEEDKAKNSKVRSGATDNINGIAIFTPSPALMITVYPTEVSPTWRGITLLHEGFHARSWVLKPHNMEDRREYALEEVHAHEFQNRITSKLGGKPYEELLEKEISRIAAKQEPIEAEQPKAIVLVKVYGYETGLDAIFGKQQSKFEEAFRQTSFFIHAEFTYIDRTRRNDEAIERKIRWYDAFTHNAPKLNNP